MTALLTPLAQGSTGLALVMGFGLLCIRQTSVGFILLAIQSGAVAVCAVATHRPLMALPPVILAAYLWLIRTWTHQDVRTEPVGGAKLGVCIGAVLAMLCQSQGNWGLPLAAALLAVLLATTRTNPFMRTIALVGLQNAIVMAACTGLPPEADLPLLLPLACLVLTLPLSAGLLIPPVAAHGYRNKPWLAPVDLGLSVAIFATTFVVPLDPIASVFAPLLGLDGVMRAEGRRKRDTESQTPHAARLTLAGRGLSQLNSIFLMLAVCAPAPFAAWLAILASIASALLPTMRRRADQALLANLGAGILLFSLLLLLSTPSSAIGYAGLFAGLAAVSAVVPELAAVSVVVLLRLAIWWNWPPAANALGIGLTLIALLGCATLLIRGRRPVAANIGEWATRAIAGSWPGTSLWTSGALTVFTDPPPQVFNSEFGTNVRASPLISGTSLNLEIPISPETPLSPGTITRVPRSAAETEGLVSISGDRATLLLLGQASIATLAICLGTPEGRFAAAVLLILTILSRSAARLTRGPIAILAFAGLSGVPPLGVFPGLVLVVLATASRNPWLMAPFVVVVIPLLLAGLPRRLPDLRSASAFRSIFWLPLILALLAGYCVPNDLSLWLHAITAGHS